MRRGLAVLLLIIMSHQLLLKLCIVVWYQYNKAYVAENLCENRDRPALKCCGKCYLNKQLAKAGADRRPGLPLDLKLSKLKMSAFVLPSAICYPIAVESAQLYYKEYPVPFPGDVWLSMEHPPG